jgi:alpha-mannosidase
MHSPAANGPVHLFVVPHTHWDREWYQPFQEFRRRLVRLTDKLLDLLERDSSFAHFHFDGQTIVLEDYLEIRPDRRQRLRRLIAGGRIAVGPWYVLPDEFLVSGESIIRNLQIGHRIAAGFGVPAKIGYLPDQFGHIAQMPQLLRGFGIEDAVVWRGVGEDVDRTEFFWEAPDGSRVFAVYLPGYGYSNGQRLPAAPERLRARLQQIINEHAAFRRIRSVLVMSGTDHQEPQDGFPQGLAAVVNTTEGLRAEIAPLARYIERARAEALGDGGLAVHRGELRSCARMHLLPGVTSMRVRQKQRDFANVSRLERYAEPLATWADRLAGERNWTAFVDWAWKLAVQNHPHDSICGCSVDQVHRDMEYRFDQVESVAKQTFERALAAVARRLDTSALATDQGLVVFNPNHAARTVVTTEITHDNPRALGLVDAEGNAVALHVEAGHTETLLDAEMPPAEVRPHIQAMTGREILGVFINAVSLRREGPKLVADLTVDDVVRGSLDMDGIRQRWLRELEDPSLGAVRIAARRAAAARLTFGANLAGFGLTTFALAPASSPPAPVFISDGHSLQNTFYRIDVEDDGTLRIRDKELDFELPRCNWFVDEGDRGDEYNFDALLDPQRVVASNRRVAVDVDARSAVAGRLRVRLEYDLPRCIEEDRETRSAELVTVAIETTATLYAELKRIDFVTTLDNRAEDHRLRVHFQTPVRADGALHEQAFAVVERSLDLEPNGRVEDAIGTVPQKTFTCVQGNGLGVALFNRGLQEIEVMRGAAGADLALTLLRAVGWLSRGDLRMRKGHAGPGMETPEGQSPGEHRFEYALTTYGGDWVQAQIVRRAHEFAYPPAAILVDRHAGDAARPITMRSPKGEVASLLQCDNPQIVVSAVTAAKRLDRFQVRCYNSAPTAQTAQLRVPAGCRPRAVDFLGASTGKRLRRGDDGWRLRFGPYEIVTLLIAPA